MTLPDRPPPASAAPGAPTQDEGGRTGLALWSTPQWREQATAWADDVLSALGIRRTGEAQQPHLRAWSTVLRLPTSAGSVWLKAPGPGTVTEVALMPVLALGTYIIPLGSVFFIPSAFFIGLLSVEGGGESLVLDLGADGGGSTLHGSAF